MALTTTQAWKGWRRIATTEYDTIVGSLLSVVTEEINRYVGRKLESDTYTDFEVDGTGTQLVTLPYWPVTAIESVKYRSDSGDTVTLGATDYRLRLDDRNRGKVYRLPYRPSPHGSGRYVDEWGVHSGRGPVWQEGVGNYLFTFTAGYAAIPDDIQKAAWVLIDSYLERQGIDIFASAAGEGNENYTARSAEDAKAEMHRLLAPYRRLP